MTAVVPDDLDFRKALIVVMDAHDRHRGEVARALTSLYRVEAFADVNTALRLVGHTPPAVFIVDESVWPLGSNLMSAQLRRHLLLASVPIVYTGNRAVAMGGRQPGISAYLRKPFRRSELIQTISGLLNGSLEELWQTLPDRHRSALRDTIDAFNGISDLIGRGEPLVYGCVQQACAPLVSAVGDNDYKTILASVRGHDNYSYVHSLRVATLLSLFGYTIGLKGDDLLVLASGGLLHDIGKMSIPHHILNKPGRLDEDEWAIMKSHVPNTVEFLRTHSDVPKGVLVIAAQHHEKLDGSGYPAGLTGRDLSELARMAAIVDVFGALTDRRVYKPSMAPERALMIMMEEMSRELDVKLVRLFRSMLLDAVTD